MGGFSRKIRRRPRCYDGASAHALRAESVSTISRFRQQMRQNFNNNHVARVVAIFLVAAQAAIAFLGVLSGIAMWPLPLYATYPHLGLLLLFCTYPMIGFYLIRKKMYVSVFATLPPVFIMFYLF